ncbi:MAG: hypothetical protein OEX77_04025 [Candidatus Bathyarchaeota archaeon]|nr:hypothetical protein [Candidatus Bathyarchaeota archaeon]MDH5732933.1 hypothetical protein [Candidatus Bathyarchaeota archaeon]
MNTQIVYEHSMLGLQNVLTYQMHIRLNQCVNEKLATKLNAVFVEGTNKSMGLNAITGQEIKPVFFDVKKAMLEAERRKAEALNMLRLRETLR